MSPVAAQPFGGDKNPYETNTHCAITSPRNTKNNNATPKGEEIL